MPLKFDFLDIFLDALATLIGRLIAIAFVLSIGTGLGVYFKADGNFAFLECLAFGIPFLFAHFFSITGFVILPVLFGFTILFTRYEWPLGFLAIPFSLCLFLGYHETTGPDDQEKSEESLRWPTTNK